MKKPSRNCGSAFGLRGIMFRAYPPGPCRSSRRSCQSPRRGRWGRKRRLRSPSVHPVIDAVPVHRGAPDGIRRAAEPVKQLCKNAQVLAGLGGKSAAQRGGVQDGGNKHVPALQLGDQVYRQTADRRNRVWNAAQLHRVCQGGVRLRHGQVFQEQLVKTHIRQLGAELRKIVRGHAVVWVKP